jgi:predicted alpha-1,2-mannosidase
MRSSSLLLFLLSFATLHADPVDDVRPAVGTFPHGHTFPGATTPFGMVQLSPDTGTGGWDWASGYNYNDDTILGFSHTHLAGTGVGDFGDILLQPGVGSIQWEPGDKKVPNSGYGSRFSHDTEVEHPGYYGVKLEDSGVHVELTATPHAGFHRYTFPAGSQAHVLIDLGHGISNGTKDSALTVESPTVISGFRHSSGWAHDKTWYFVAEFSQPIASTALRVDNVVQPEGATAAQGKRVEAGLQFSKTDAPLLIRIGLSPTSIDEARKNLAAEIPGWDFDGMVAAARKTWNDALSRIQAESIDPALRQTFYTALYHSMIAPNLYNNADGSYRGADGQVHDAAFSYYQTFSFWDTYRAEHPLLTLVQPERVNDFVNTALVYYDQLNQQSLPVWPLASNETWCMIATHSIPVIVEAYRKGFRDYDAQKAYADMVGTVNDDRQERAQYRQYGYVLSGSKGAAAVSRTMEMAYDDAAISRLATALGKTDDAKLYAERAENFRKLYDSKTGFMRGRLADGSFREPFDPRVCTTVDYTEANAYQYLFYVPQDVAGLIELMGGDAAFIDRLDDLFSTDSKLINAPPDISGLIGQYSQGDEQCHHVAFLYDYAGAPYKTQKHIRDVMKLYGNTPDGLCGNDDCGQMSAWYVLSAMGFYPVDPTSGVYVIGSPLLDKATIQLDPKYYPGGTFTIEAKNNSARNLYIQSATWDGKPFDRCWFSQAELAKGGTLVLNMGPRPNKKWGAAASARPPTNLPF